MSTSKLVKIDDFGRVLIPKNIRNHLGLQSGVTVRLKELDDEQLILEIVRKKPLLENHDSVLVFRGKAIHDIEGSVQEMRHERLHKLTRDFE